MLARLGFGPITACDVDPEAIQVAAKVLEANGLRAAVRLLRGSASACPGTYQLVIANILGEILLSIRDSLLSRVAPGGALVLSGVLVRDQGAFRASLGLPDGWRVESEAEEGPWWACRLRRHVC